MLKTAFAAVFGLLALLCPPAAAQTPPGTGNEFPTQTPGQSVVGVGTMCLNSSGQMVPWFNKSGTWQCAGSAVPVASSGAGVPFGTYSTASIAGVNGVTYTPNTAWNNTNTPTFFSFTGACRANGAQVLVPQIDIWSSANPTLKLQGILWLFSAVPGTNVADNANFNIAAADYANLTGLFDGIPFTLTANQGSGAANSGVSLKGTTYQMQCASGTTTITGMVQVVNAYVRAAAEVLHVALRTTGVN